MYIDDKVYLGQITVNNSIQQTPDWLDGAKHDKADGEMLALLFVLKTVSGTSGNVGFTVKRGPALGPQANDPVSGMLEVDGAQLGTKTKEVLVPFTEPEPWDGQTIIYGEIDTSTNGAGRIIADVYAVPYRTGTRDYLSHHEAQQVI